MLEILEFATGPQPRTTLIVLHGLGASSDDFVPVCEALRLQPLGDVRFVLPQAPVRPVTLNGGYAMPAWFDILGPYPAPAEDEAGLRASQARIEALIARERERGVASERIVLMGFSQGCAMTLMTALRYPERLGGAIGLSGYLPLAATTATERSAVNADLPFFLGHGTQDTVVVPPRGRAARDALQALGHPVAWHEYPMDHSVCLEEINDLNAWCLRHLA
ncbi:MAG: carboxylesterase [Roseateles depolymerans]|uniref:Carboxylesterase n=1 Tax=Roseateles depolymerans TaxID=76731 RepID=A0A2W5FCR0_9BURK|nr:MAG: carboxylesterase [Roseateles depolymerans]